MTIELATADEQLTLQRRTVIAAHQLQRFAENAAPITAGQAVDIDAACEALLTALGNAGYASTASPTDVTLSSGVAVTGVTFTGTTGTTLTPTIVDGVLTAVARS